MKRTRQKGNTQDEEEEVADTDDSYRRWQAEVKRLKQQRQGVQVMSQGTIQEQRERVQQLQKIREQHESVHQLQKKLFEGQKWVLFLVVSTLILGILVNEFCSGGGDYVAYQITFEEIAARRAQQGCPYGPAEPLKILLSVLSFFLVALVTYQWNCRVHIDTAAQKLKECHSLPMDAHLIVHHTPLSSYFNLLWECVVCSVHPLPHVYAIWEFDLGHEGWDIPPILYRFESIAVSLMFLRLYLVWRWFKLLCYHRSGFPYEKTKRNRGETEAMKYGRAVFWLVEGNIIWSDNYVRFAKTQVWCTAKSKENGLVHLILVRNVQESN